MRAAAAGGVAGPRVRAAAAHALKPQHPAAQAHQVLPGAGAAARSVMLAARVGGRLRMALLRRA